MSQNAVRSKFPALSDNLDTEEPKDIEVTAQIAVPPDGGWGWAVVFSSFLIIGISDGVSGTFGSLYPVLLADLKLPESVVPLINSVTIASIYCLGPVVSALINRYGFRFCVMLGSGTSSMCCLVTFLLGDFSALLFFYGLIAGFGYSMLTMTPILIVAYYFQRHRSLACILALSGSSIGVVFFSLLYSHTAYTVGWQYTILLQSSILGCCFFISMTYRPLLSMTVVKTITHEQIKSMLSLTHLSEKEIKCEEVIRISIKEQEGNKSRIFNAESNMQFPTAAELIKEIAEDSSAGASNDLIPGPSRGLSHLKFIRNNTDIAFHEHDLEQVKSMLAQTAAKANETEDTEKTKLTIDIEWDEETQEKHAETHQKRRDSVLKDVFHWEKHVEESRPLYRDDAFLYNGADIAEIFREEKTENAIEYQLKMSRVATSLDLKERRGIFTLAFRRVLATMLNPAYLKRRSFLRICFSMMFYFIANMIPIVFVIIRGKELGIPLRYRRYFLSCIAFAGIFGRLFIYVFTIYRVPPMQVARVNFTILGILTILSCFGTTTVFQISYCLLYGFFAAGTGNLRTGMIVYFYGIENLTNCTGLAFLFQGFGCLISPPLAGAFKNVGNLVPFMFSGTCFLVSAILLVPVAEMVEKEKMEIGELSPLVRPSISVHK